MGYSFLIINATCIKETYHNEQILITLDSILKRQNEL